MFSGKPMKQRKQLEPAADRTKTRVLVVALCLFCWMLLIMWRLAWLQIARHAEFKERASALQHKEQVVQAPRGDITDRLGNPFALSVFFDSIYADPRMLRAPEKAEERLRTAQVLAPVLGLSQADLLNLLTSNKASVWLRRQMPLEVTQQVQQLIKKHRLAAVKVVKEPQRSYPNAQLAAHVIGAVSADEVGIEGLERLLETKLQGLSGKMEFEQNAAGQPLARLDTSAISGARVVTTIDSILQHKVEVILAETLAQTHARSVSAIVLDPHTGEVLALANAPTFDPNERPKSLNDARRNRAITDAYEPGSVFKIVTYAAALEEGLVRPTDLLNCQGGTITLGRHTFHDSHLGLGTVTVADAFAKSSNVGAIKTVQRLGDERFFQWIKRFGFNQRAGLELPGEVAGFLRPIKDWHVDSIGSLAIGQEISVTALQTVAAYATVANQGVWVKPHLIQKLVASDGRVLSETQPETRRVLSEAVAQQMNQMMQQVVDEGTGKRAQVSSYTVAGKTGTPQKYVRGLGYKSGKFTPTFVGFVPATQPRFAIIVLVDEPQGLHQGGQVAAPAFNLIAEAALTDYLVMPDDQHFRAGLNKLLEESKGKAPEQTVGQTQAQMPAGAASKDPLTKPLASAGQSPPTPPPANPQLALQSRLPVAPAPVKGQAANAPASNASVMPDLRGLGVRAVAQACGNLSLRPKLRGSGQAVRQSPAPGTRVKPGSFCQVEFN
jgi:cell division protein FtsI/penicillin-binding protein 2